MDKDDTDLLLIGEFRNWLHDPGRAHVFRFLGQGWAEVAELHGSDEESGDDFGFSVGMNQSTVICGAPAWDYNVNDSSGAVYGYDDDFDEMEACCCPADFDGDGDVDTADLLHLLGCWGQSCGDVDGDNDTDTADLLLLLGAWGPCSAPGSGDIPQSVQDCIDKFGFGDPEALEACIFAVSSGSE